MSHLCFSFLILSYSEKLLATFCVSNLPLACSFSVRKGWDSTDNVSAACCLSVSVSRKSLTAQACSYVNRLAAGFLAKSMTACKALRHTASNVSIAFRNADLRRYDEIFLQKGSFVRTFIALCLFQQPIVTLGELVIFL